MYEVRKALVFGAFVVAFVMISSATLVPQTTSAQVVKTINKTKQTKELLTKTLNSVFVKGSLTIDIILIIVSLVICIIASLIWPKFVEIMIILMTILIPIINIC